jgi:hypothetical protein
MTVTGMLAVMAGEAGKRRAPKQFQATREVPEWASLYRLRQRTENRSAPPTPLPTMRSSGPAVRFRIGKFFWLE